MKIRTSLVLACFALSVLPLGGIVVYSYYASSRALQSVYQGEAARLTAQMDCRMGNIREVLEQRLAEISALPNLPNAEKEKTPLVGNILMTMGEAAALVDSLEIQPVVRQVTVEAAPPPAEPIVIDIPPPPKLPRFRFTDEQRAELKQISEIGRQLGTRWNELTPERRDAL